MRMSFKYFILALAFASSSSVLAQDFRKIDNSRFGIGPTLGHFDSTIGFGTTFDLLFKGMQNAPLYFGLESGVVYWSDSGSAGSLSASVSLTSIPILPMVLYQFDLPASSVKPYIGVALGISITPMSATVSYGGLSGSGSSTQIYFEGLVKPGLEISSFFIEPKLGLLKDEFVFLPTIGYFFDF